MLRKNYDESIKVNHKPNWPCIPDHPYGILIKTNLLLNLIKHQWPDIDKISLSVKDPFQSKYQLLINGRKKKVGSKKLKNLKQLVDYSQTVDDDYENSKDYNPKDYKQRKKSVNSIWWYDSRYRISWKFKSYCYWILFKSKKAQYFTCT